MELDATVGRTSAVESGLLNRLEDFVHIAAGSQLELFEPDVSLGEDPEFYRRQIITYIGNKRQLLEPIGRVTTEVCSELGKDKLRVLDAFAGSGIVSRLFKSFSSQLVVNDLEPYARVVASCYLSNHSEVDRREVENVVEKMNRLVDSGRVGEPGFIERLYAPKDDNAIRLGERVFYTRDNARRLDQFRTLIEEQDPALFDLLSGPLLSAASVHANTAGVFKGFYKDRDTRRGKFGGSGGDALERIKGQIRLQPPILSKFECSVEVHQSDANDLVSNVGEFDLAYFDPPYNQHPYGSNYFMLNLLVDYIAPEEISQVSGIPLNWNRSRYNQKRRAFECLADLIRRVDSRYVLLSFNDEGFITPADLRKLLAEHGPVREVQLKYNTFRGSRNLRARRTHVTEHLFLLSKRN